MRDLLSSFRMPALSAAALLMAACAGPSREPEVAYARQALVGMPVQTLLACAGVPERTAQVQGTEYLTYVEREGGGAFGPTAGLRLGTGTFGSNVGVGVGIGVPLLGGSGYAVRDQCEATFVVQNGVVQGLTYGADAETRQCFEIVRNCLPAGPAPA